MVCPKIRTKLKTSQVVKNKKVTIENGSKILSLVFSLFFKIKTPPNDAKTKPNSSGWWDQDINPSIPKTSWDSESPNPEIIWRIEPIITSLIPVLREPWTDFWINRIAPIIAAIAVIETPVYTTMCDGLQKNSGSFCKWDIASQNPADTTTTGPITARIITNESRKFGFTNDEFEILWINFMLITPRLGYLKSCKAYQLEKFNIKANFVN